MEATRLAPTVGIVASLVVLAVLAAPYTIIDSSAVGVYYATGAINVLLLGLFAPIALIVFAAGREGRSAPDMVAGVALVLGTFMVVIATAWALSVPEQLVAQLTTVTAIKYHRVALVAVALVVPASAVWYARTLRIF